MGGYLKEGMFLKGFIDGGMRGRLKMKSEVTGYFFSRKIDVAPENREMNVLPGLNRKEKRNVHDPMIKASFEEMCRLKPSIVIKGKEDGRFLEDDSTAKPKRLWVFVKFSMTRRRQV